MALPRVGGGRTWLPKLRRVARHDDIAHHRQLTTAPKGEAVHGSYGLLVEHRDGVDLLLSPSLTTLPDARV